MPRTRRSFVVIFIALIIIEVDLLVTTVLVISHHFFNDWDTSTAVFERIRRTYDGPLSLANDFMVWNVTKDEIKVRMTHADEATWAPPLGAPAQPPSLKDRESFADKLGMDINDIGFSEFTKAGFWDVDDVLRPIYQEASDKLGREFPYPGDE